MEEQKCVFVLLLRLEILLHHRCYCHSIASSKKMTRRQKSFNAFRFEQPCLRLSDPHFDKIARAFVGVLEQHQLIRPRSTGKNFFVVLARALDKHFKCFALQSSVELPTDLVLHRHQPLEPLMLEPIVNLIVERRRRRLAPRGAATFAVE